MYWLFQSNPDVFRLRDALRAEALETFAITAHKQDIHKEDKIILWQSGKEAGCYGLATVTSEVGELPIGKKEKPFFKELPEELMRVSLKIEYNLWNKPLTWEMLRDIPVFEDFNAGLPGTNFIATEQQYKVLEEIAKQLDLLAEPQIPYGIPPAPEFPLNMILYGPPGTGKTYQTINYALAIIENRPMEELAMENRQQLRQRFETYVAQGQVAFVTFHQSFSYEDFVEGIKPQVLENGTVNYGVAHGIFKMMAYTARNCVVEALMREQPQEQQKMKFNQLYKAFLEFLESDQFEYFQTSNEQQLYLQQIYKNGDLALRPAIAFNTYTVEKNLLRKFYQQFPKPEDLPAAEQYIDKNIRGSESDYYWTVFATLKNFENYYIQQQQKQQAEAQQPEVLYELVDDLPLLPNQVLAKCKRYVIIIDEINRGNAAGIFGELITLLEPDKREGRHEALMTILPYSRTFFAIPPNLYVLGTMNTADRSVDALDVALRRRFAFREVPPAPEVIANFANKPVIQGIDLAKLLDTINRRIERLLDREHRIGHAYFLEVDSLDELKQIFAERIIPLLQEYFFNDYARIGLVLGKDFICKQPADIDFADFDHPYVGEFTERKLYTLANVADLEEEAFIRIYEKG